jgi:glycosyltransferase involved in cell wall biosynthesis
MRVGIDVGGALRPDTGSGRYTHELVHALARVAPELEIILLSNAFRARDHGARCPLPGRVVNPRIPDRLLLAAWRRLRWPPVDALVGRVDVFHASDWVHPPQRRGVSVTTINDLGPLVHPEWYSPDVVSIHRRKNLAAAERAALIITISEFTRREFLSAFDVDPGRVRAVALGVSPAFRARDPGRAVATARRLGLTTPFVLYVGTREPRKNVTGLIDIFGRMRARRPDLTLAIVGMRPDREAAYVHGVGRWAGPEVEDRVRRLGLEPAVCVVGFVSLRELIDLYSAAAVLVYPTMYEGFGLPLLEAMACGLPVVASNRSAVPEVVGDAGILSDPDDPDRFAADAVRVLEDAALRDRCRTRGLARVARFTWDATARETLAIYHEAMTCGRNGGS